MMCESVSRKKMVEDAVAIQFYLVSRDFSKLCSSGFLRSSRFPRGFRTPRRWGKRKPGACPDRCYVNVPEDRLLVKVIESLLKTVEKIE